MLNSVGMNVSNNVNFGAKLRKIDPRTPIKMSFEMATKISNSGNPEASKQMYELATIFHTYLNNPKKLFIELTKLKKEFGI